MPSPLLREAPTEERTVRISFFKRFRINSDIHRRDVHFLLAENLTFHNKTVDGYVQFRIGSSARQYSTR